MLLYENMNEQRPLLDLVSSGNNCHLPSGGYQNSVKEAGLNYRSIPVQEEQPPSNLQRVAQPANDISTDPFYEGLVSFVGGVFCCSPYTTVNQGHELVVIRPHFQRVIIICDLLLIGVILYQRGFLLRIM